MLQYGKSRLACNSHHGKSWLGFSTLALTGCSVPPWLQDVLGAPVEACAQAGSEDGYLVVELATPTQLRAISTPGESLAGHCRRALIVSCPVPEGSALYGEDILLRYFAPQYGQAEDIATGSAMRILAPYWQHRGYGSRLKALQCSAQGGLLYSQIEDGLTWVGGRLAALGAEEAIGG